jgi:hypothetical protein
MGSEGLSEPWTQPQRRALVPVVATGYPLGVLTRRVEMCARGMIGSC